MPDRQTPNADDALEDLYREVILDHYKNPRHLGQVQGNDTVAVELQNPTCGDEIRLSLRVQDGCIEDVRFEGRGCSISMASASMMADALRGKSLREASTLNAAFKGMLAGGDVAEEALGDLVALSGVSHFPVRVKCATLAWNALLTALGTANEAAAGHR